MAHQADKIPWHLLSSNLRWVPQGSCKCKAANLHPCMKPGQGKELNLFVRELESLIEDQALREREKYPETYELPQPSDVVLDEDVVKRISPAVRRWRIHRQFFKDCDKTDCRRGLVGSDYCQCTSIPEKCKLMSSFIGEYPKKGEILDYDTFVYEKGFYYSLQLVKILLCYEEMDAILRLCAHPDVSFKDWQSRYVFVSSRGRHLI